MTLEQLDSVTTGETGAANAASQTASPDTGSTQMDSGAAQAASSPSETDASSTTDTRQQTSNPQQLLREAAGSAPVGETTPAAPVPVSLQSAPNPLTGQTSAPAKAEATALPPELQQLLGSPEGIQKLSNLSRAYGSVSRELGELRKEKQSWEGQQAERQQAAQLANIRPFQKQHPDYAKTMDSVSRVKAFKAALNAAPQELQDDASYRGRLAQQMRVSMDDAKAHDQFEEHREQTVQQLATDPESFIDSRVDQIVQQRLAQFEQAIQHRGEVQHLLDSNKDLIGKRRDDILQSMNNPHRRDEAIQKAMLMEEVEQLRLKLAEDSRHVTAAKAQRHIAQGRASEPARRDPVSSAIIHDPSADLVKNGANPKEIFQALSRHAEQLRNQT